MPLARAGPQAARRHQRQKALGVVRKIAQHKTHLAGIDIGLLELRPHSAGVELPAVRAGQRFEAVDHHGGVGLAVADLLHRVLDRGNLGARRHGQRERGSDQERHQGRQQRRGRNLNKVLRFIHSSPQYLDDGGIPARRQEWKFGYPQVRHRRPGCYRTIPPGTRRRFAPRTRRSTPGPIARIRSPGFAPDSYRPDHGLAVARGNGLAEPPQGRRASRSSSTWAVARRMASFSTVVASRGACRVRPGRRRG